MKIWHEEQEIGGEMIRAHGTPRQFPAKLWGTVVQLENGVRSAFKSQSCRAQKIADLTSHNFWKTDNASRKHSLVDLRVKIKGEDRWSLHKGPLRTASYGVTNSQTVESRCVVTQNKTHTHVLVPTVPGGAAGRKEAGRLISSFQKRHFALDLPSRNQALGLPTHLRGLAKARLGRLISPLRAT